MEKEITLAEIFVDLRKELQKIENPPLSFSTNQFCEELKISQSHGRRTLKRFESENRVRKVKIKVKDKNDKITSVWGWQWITKQE